MPARSRSLTCFETPPETYRTGAQARQCCKAFQKEGLQSRDAPGWTAPGKRCRGDPAGIQPFGLISAIGALSTKTADADAWIIARASQRPARGQYPAGDIVLREFAPAPSHAPRQQTIEALEAHDQRPPFVGIDAVRLARHQNIGMQRNAQNTNLEGTIAPRTISYPCDNGFHLHGTSEHTRRTHSERRDRRETGDLELVLFMRIAARLFRSRDRIRAL
jgi:hypothetical protein